MSSISEATTKFCLDFFKVLNEDRPSGNIIYSPLSILAALSTVFLGARGNTAAQMQKIGNNKHFHWSSDCSLNLGFLKNKLLSKICDIPGGIHSQFHDIFSAINKPTTSYELANANRLYGEQTFQFLQQYLSCTQKLYQAELKPSDFLNAAEETRKQINLWVEVFTKGKIKDLFAPGTLSPDTVLVLVNAVYFKGQWAVEFKKENTKERPFQINKTTSKPVKMMYHIGKYKIATNEEHDSQVLELPYKGLEKDLTYEKLTTWNSPDHLKEDEVEVSLPQFKIETRVSDLSGMAKEGGLFVSHIVHKAYIEVNEEGTVAAAATEDEVTTTLARIPVQFVADHPFLFFIRHQKTKCIIFYGRFSSP
uniref:Serpin domain-containing protein n=1 Tax=Gopherus evgoodei TaxID=1825980 RepID=A0A8C4XYN5_9SAUR